MRKNIIIFWSLLFSVCIYRIIFYGINIENISNNCLQKNISGIGSIVNEPEQKESSQIVVIKVQSATRDQIGEVCDPISMIRLKTKLYPQYYYNNQVSFSGKLSKPNNFGMDNFDYIGYLAKDNIYFEIKSATLSLLENESALTNDYTFSFLGIYTHILDKLFLFKRYFETILKRNFSEPYSALATGLLLGEKSSLGKDLLDDFRKVGLIHIIVLSGYNITIVGDTLRKIFLFLPRVWGITMGGIGIVLFGLMVGGGATVVRTCAMASIGLFAQTIRRDYSVIRSLIFVGLIMIILNPKIFLYDPSFQLSFLATLGLILLGKFFDDKFKFITARFGIRSIVSSTFATQFFVTPFLLYKMGQVSVIGIIVNILVLPVIPITMLMVFITGISGMISFAFSKPFALFTYILLKYEIFMVKYFASFSFSALNINFFNTKITSIYYILLVIFVIYININNRSK